MKYIVKGCIEIPSQNFRDEFHVDKYVSYMDARSAMRYSFHQSAAIALKNVDGYVTTVTPYDCKLYDDITKNKIHLWLEDENGNILDK